MALSFRPAVLVPNADVDGDDVTDEDVGVGGESYRKTWRKTAMMRPRIRLKFLARIH
jgi:hypothetical protein